MQRSTHLGKATPLNRHERHLKLLHNDLMNLDSQILQESASKLHGRFHDISNLNPPPHSNLCEKLMATPSQTEINSSFLQTMNSHYSGNKGLCFSEAVENGRVNMKENAMMAGLAPTFSQSPESRIQRPQFSDTSPSQVEFNSPPGLNDTTRIDITQLAHEKEKRVEYALKQNVREKELTKINCAKEFQELKMLIQTRERNLHKLELEYSEMSQLEQPSSDEEKLFEIERKAERMAGEIREEEKVVEEKKTNVDIEEVALQEALMELQKEYQEKHEEVQKDLKIKNGMIENFSQQFEENERKLSEQLVPLHQKHDNLRNNLRQLSAMIRQTEEEMQMTKEDLTSKLMQRAQYVAWHESIEEAQENFKKQEIHYDFFLKVIEKNRTPDEDNKLIEQYGYIRKREFFRSVLEIIKKNCKKTMASYHGSLNFDDTGEFSIDDSTADSEEILEELELLRDRVEGGTLEGLEIVMGGEMCVMVEFASKLNIGIDSEYFSEKLKMVSKNKAKAYHEKKMNLLQIVRELSKYENLIKINMNFVDNMVVPQYKAIDESLQSMKNKYKRNEEKINELKEKIKEIQAKITVIQNEHQHQMRKVERSLLSQLNTYEKQDFLKEIEKIIQEKKTELKEKESHFSTDREAIKTKIEKLMIEEARLREEGEKLRDLVTSKNQQKNANIRAIRNKISEEGELLQSARLKAQKWEAKLKNAQDMHQNARLVFLDTKSRMRPHKVLSEKRMAKAKSSRQTDRSGHRSRQVVLNGSNSATSKNSPYLDLSSIRIDSPNEDVVKMVRRSLRGIQQVKPFKVIPGHRRGHCEEFIPPQKYETVNHSLVQSERREVLQERDFGQRPSSSLETVSEKVPRQFKITRDYNLPFKPATSDRAHGLRQSLNMLLPNCDELLSPNKTSHSNTQSGLTSLCDENTTMRSSQTKIEPLESSSILKGARQDYSLFKSAYEPKSRFKRETADPHFQCNLERERFNTSESRMSLIEPKPCREMIQVATDSGFSSLAPSHSRYASKVSEESDTRLSMMRSSSVESNVMRSALDYDCMRTSISSGLSRGAMQAHHAKNYRISIKDCTRKDIKFFEAINPLLEGAQFFKQYSQQTNFITARRTFDPLNTEFPPQECGYSERFFALHQSLEYIEVRELLKPGMLSKINVYNIKKPQLNKQTYDIIKIQQAGLKRAKKRRNSSREQNYVIEDRRSSSVSSRKGDEEGMPSQQREFEEKCRDCIYYPFSISLQEGGKLELISCKYEQMKSWILGIKALVNNKKSLGRLSKHISIIS